jgi:hypothetical protein
LPESCLILTGLQPGENGIEARETVSTVSSRENRRYTRLKPGEHDTQSS